jgi:hypothetical protein
MERADTETAKLLELHSDCDRNQDSASSSIPKVLSNGGIVQSCIQNRNSFSLLERLWLASITWNNLFDLSAPKYWP